MAVCFKHGTLPALLGHCGSAVRISRRAFPAGSALTKAIMEERPKILLLDDDADLLAVYREILAQLPSQPEIFVATNGPRAMKLLESESFRVFICDLKMPKMDGLQVLSAVRRKYPQLRTVVLTSVVDEQFRSRVYALGVDLFWQKPSSDEEVKMFLECIESLLEREDTGGFRGVQSKSLVDIIQLECLSQTSAVLRITNGPLVGKIWIVNGEVTDAETEQLTGEDAFRKILSWKEGNFELLAPDPTRPRRITKSYNALLLETAQAIDESAEGGAEGTTKQAAQTLIGLMKQFEGIEFVLVARQVKQADKKPQPGGKKGESEEVHIEACGLENPQPLSNWARSTLELFGALAEKLQTGPLEQVVALGQQRNVAVAPQNGAAFCVGWNCNMTPEDVSETTKKVIAQWAS